LPSAILLFLLLFFTVLPLSDAQADIYEWVDANGTVHLSDNPPDLPPGYRKNARIIKAYQIQSNAPSIPFERTPAGLIVVDAVLNGAVSTKMVFDTGADAVVVTERLARRLNQDIRGAGEITLHTNCGDVSGQVFTLDKIELAGVGKQNVRAVVAPPESSLGGHDALLGLSFLRDFKITVDYRKGRITISKED